MTVSKHYDSKYFDWQSRIGEFGGWANLTKFERYITSNDKVLDFGCGGGYLLKNINCKEKYGVEVNETAAKIAKNNNIIVSKSANSLPEEYFDIIISNHALEHTHAPLNEIKLLNSKLKKSGKIIFVVPCETIAYSYKPGDINNHIYSWSPMCLGNLFTEAGFKVIESKAYNHKWPPFYQIIAKIGGRKVFDFASKVYSRIERSYSQVRIIAEK